MSALTGVGPSIASGSHVWRGTCADLATAPPSSPRATRTARVEPSPSASGAAAKTVAKSSEPVCWTRMKRASTKVASPNGVHDERLLARFDGRAPLMPVVDEQVRGEADHSPPGQEQQQVPAHDEQEHREDEERLVGVVAPLLLVPVHVADRVDEDEEADPRDHQHHEDGERVDQHRGPDAQLAGGQPRPGGREDRAVLRLAAEQVEEERDGADEREEGCPGREQPRPAPVDALAEERDRDHRGGGREQGGPGENVHALAVERSKAVDVELDPLA